jgi:hypothetical protein
MYGCSLVTIDPLTVKLWSVGRSGGRVRIEACIAAMDGGALYALAPVRFSAVLSNRSGEVEINEPITTMAKNVAGARGGGITSWAPISVGFGYRLVCTYGQAICDLGY